MTQNQDRARVSSALAALKALELRVIALEKMRWPMLAAAAVAGAGVAGLVRLLG